jgi:xanthine dehydrogenase YagS FAD-binding subunit
MKPFDYYVAENADAALQHLGGDKPLKLKAGGIDLVDLMKEGVAEPDAVLTIGELPDMDYIKEDGEGARLGCLATLAQIGRSSLIAERAAALHHAAGHAATPQVRERATLGGNLCQRPRCWYFRNQEFNCLKQGGPTCYALEGENQYHAIFGDGPCYIVHPSNCAPPLVALNAELLVRSKDGERTVAAAEFFQLPSRNLYGENILEDGEIVVEARIPKAAEQSATIELREKQSFDWPLVMASVARIGGKWNVCLGAVSPVPHVSKEAADVMGSSDVTEELAAKAGEAAAHGAEPLSDNAYKVPLVKAAVKRALMKAAGMETPA